MNYQHPWGSHNWDAVGLGRLADWPKGHMLPAQPARCFSACGRWTHLSCSRLRYGSTLSYCFFKTGHFGGHHSTDTSTLPKCSCQWWMVCFAQGMSQFDKKHVDLKTAEIYAHQFHRLAKSSSLGEKKPPKHELEKKTTVTERHRLEGTKTVSRYCIRNSNAIHVMADSLENDQKSHGDVQRISHCGWISSPFSASGNVHHLVVAKCPIKHREIYPQMIHFN